MKTDNSTLRWLTCGHVDDGKSTLMGCLWHAMGVVPNEIIENARRVDGTIDYADLLDGLEDEQAQGITIDVAWRFALYADQHWILADTPGHQQYTRNMAVAASYSDGALIVLDASHGVREQTIRHSKILDFFAITKKVVVVNKMDVVEYSQERFNQVKADILELLSNQTEGELVVIPAAALYGEMVQARGDNLSWYLGPTVLEALQEIDLRAKTNQDRKDKSSAIYVQSCIRHNNRRVYLGSVVAGDIQVGERVFVAGRKDLSAVVSQLWIAGNVEKTATINNAVTIQFDSELDIARGSILTVNPESYLTSSAVIAKVVWLVPDYTNLATWQGSLKIGHQTISVYVTTKDTDSRLTQISGSAEVEIEAALPVSFRKSKTPSRENLFLLINSETAATVAIGMITEDMQEKDWSI